MVQRNEAPSEAGKPGSSDERPNPAFSIVIPAHNEERVIARCLEEIRDIADRVEIIVVANGCTDSTVKIAKHFSSVKIVELAEASKSAALNAGDEAASSFPRIYLDADVRVSAEALRDLAAQLAGPRAAVGSPTVSFDISRSSFLAKSFYRAYEKTPYIAFGLVGLGVYGLSQAGRGRFDRFPAFIADDLFVQRHFAMEERVRGGGTFVVYAPRNALQLLKVRIRVAKGNRQIAASSGYQSNFNGSRTSTRTIRSLARSARTSPMSAFDTSVYVLLTATSRVLSRMSNTQWLRDESTR